MKANRFPRLLSFTILSLLFGFAISSCSEDPLDLGDVENYTVKKDTVWTAGSPIIVRGEMRVEGATLRIEAGTRIQFGKGAQLVIGKESAASLQVEGTAESPVVFESRAGDGWSGIRLMKTGGKTSLKHLQVNGAGDSSNPALSIKKLTFPIEALKIADARGMGLSIAEAGAGASLSGLKLGSKKDHPLSVGVSVLEHLPADLTLEAKEGKGIRISGGTAVAEQIDLRYKNYYISGQVSLNAARLNMGPDANFRCEQGSGIIIGEEFNTLLTCKSSLFTSAKGEDQKQQGQWSGLQIQEKTLPNSVIDGCIIEAGGALGVNAGLAIFYVNGITVRNSTFRLNRGYGIACHSCAINSEGNILNGNSKDGVAQL